MLDPDGSALPHAVTLPMLLASMPPLLQRRCWPLFGTSTVPPATEMHF